MDKVLAGKTALVTGAASGIGRATARRLAQAGATVIVADIDDKGGQATVAGIAEAGGSARFIAVDLCEAQSIDRCAQEALAVTGGVGIVVNVAGWGISQPFVQNTPEFWDRVLAINLMGPIRLTHRLVAPMFEARSGKIVNVASDAGRVGSLGETVYSAAKGGLIAFTKGLAREAARNGVNVNCVCPGPTDTPLYQAVPEKLREAFVKAIPFRRVGQPGEVADAILFFASAQSDYVTGQVLSVSGGLTMAG
jgi:2-hydroxycyclohexanecarboxyl-CoA dehydrogenase